MEAIVGILLGGVLLFNAVVTPGRAAKEAEKSLRKKFPGATVNVDIEGKRGKDVLNGKFKSVRIELSNARVDGFPIQTGQAGTKIGTIGHLELELHDLTFGDLPVKTATLSFDDVQYDFKALKKDSNIRLIAFSNGKIALGVEASALTPTFAKRAPEILNPHIEVQMGEMILSGRRDVLGIGTSVEVRGAIVARDKSLELDGARVAVGKLNLLPLIAAPIIKGINPLYEFDTDNSWPLNLKIERITADNNLLQLEGNLTPK